MAEFLRGKKKVVVLRSPKGGRILTRETGGVILRSRKSGRISYEGKKEGHFEAT